MNKLYDTYELSLRAGNVESSRRPAPPFHVIQQAHIQVTLDGAGTFRRAKVIEKEDTVIPATEKSATARTSGIAPHPLCDHIKYCAGDYCDPESSDSPHFKEYIEQLQAWCDSTFAHPKASAIFAYVRKRRLLEDLVREGVVPVDENRVPISRWQGSGEKPLLLQQLTAENGQYKPQNALIRWAVEDGTDPIAETWKDHELQAAWIRYCEHEETQIGLCMVTGENCPLADKHPKGIRGGKDGAKLISYKKDNESDFTYLGRFHNASQALGVGRDVSQKAHSTLKWLIERQAYHDKVTGQVIVAWAITGRPIPDLFANSALLFGVEESSSSESEPDAGDLGQSYALRLRRAIAGYRAQLDDSDNIVVMGLDSAVPGRMAITYYRELTSSEFLDRIQSWHARYAWSQNYGKNRTFIGAPAPSEIAEAAYGKRVEGKNGKKLLRSTLERLLPCIIDAQTAPRDLVESCVRRAKSRLCFERDVKKKDESAWEKCLGIACALYVGFNFERKYKMTLEENRKTRDYLYGRLFALAEHIESRALHLADEKRDTTAARLMQRFADRPFSTWRTIETALGPYKSRLRAMRGPFLREKERILDEIFSLFQNDIQGEAFENDRALSGEFLLAYHCQRKRLWDDEAKRKLNDDASMA